jgi:hypothetical protein
MSESGKSSKLYFTSQMLDLAWFAYFARTSFKAGKCKKPLILLLLVVLLLVLLRDWNQALKVFLVCHCQRPKP